VLGDTELLDDLGNGLTLALQNFGFAQFADDRFGGVPFSRFRLGHR
jgi:hypothetical protein